MSATTVDSIAATAAAVALIAALALWGAFSDDWRRYRGSQALALAVFVAWALALGYIRGGQ